MSAYHQLGHHSANLVLEPGLTKYKGVILSPVNYSPADTKECCANFRKKRKDIDIVFDPQLYVPLQGRGSLPTWGYMPDGVDTTDLTTKEAWLTIIDEIIEAASPFIPNGICSPAPHPRAASDGYYDFLAELGNDLHEKLKGSSSRPFLTALVEMQDLAIPKRHLQVASLLSKFKGTDIYLVLSDDTSPRLERTRSDELEAAARLIRLLQNAGYKVLVSTTSSEMVLWKAAGAAHVATGKYFNLRRFTRGRFDAEEESGGRNLWYWFEPSLLAFLREADLARFMGLLPLSPTHADNPYSKAILEKLGAPEKAPVLADSWRQFLFWFAQCEEDIDAKPDMVSGILDDAEERWEAVAANRLRFEERKNNGEWVRAWGIALNELTQRPD